MRKGSKLPSVSRRSARAVTRGEAESTELTRLIDKRTGDMLLKLDLRTADDLLHHYPRRYVERGELTPLHQGEPGEYVTYVARVKKKNQTRVRNNTLTLTLVIFTDGTTDMKTAFFSKSNYTVNKTIKNLSVGDLAMITGRVHRNRYRGESGPSRELIHPEVTTIAQEADPNLDAGAAAAEAAKPLPIYPTTKGLHNEAIRNSLKTLLGPMQPSDVNDLVPEETRARHGLLPLAEALWQIHFPDTFDRARQAQHTLRFHEAFVLQAALARRRMDADTFDATPRPYTSGGLVDALDDQLPFTLTDGQLAIAAELTEDLAGARPMQRLLQGEVGSGKTIVALRAMLQVLDSGGQAALLAPTEVLAAQHARSITAMLGSLADPMATGLLRGEAHTRVVLLTGSMPTSKRRETLLAAASGEAGIVIGTHALLSDNVQFAELGLVVVDEQHRFGVEQRDVLRTKADKVPHFLVMTATPIPRSVAMTIFGDVDTSTLRELPAGRAPIETHVVPEWNTEWMNRIWGRVAEEVSGGGRAYIVAPRIGEEDDRESLDGTELIDADLLDTELPDDGSERPPLKSVLELAQQLAEKPELAGITMQIMHGRLNAEEKDSVMADFASGAAPILISTTVIEVGVDVPEATTMVIMDAHMFGLSQLHQLRGRVGRGDRGGICLVVTSSDAKTAVQRLEVFASTTDGFELAEADLSFRREGDVLGRAQSGRATSLKLLRVIKDADLIADARESAFELLQGDPDLEAHSALKAAVAALAEQEDYLDRA